MLKSTYETVWDLEPELLDNTCRNQFRQLSDVNQYIMSYYNICMGKFSPRSPSFGRCYNIGVMNDALYEDIRQGIHKIICINDHEGVVCFEEEKDRLLLLYSTKLPVKSAFEY